MGTTTHRGSAKQLSAILIAIAIVIGAGLLVGQAPAIFGADVADDPEASITFENQDGNGTSVEIDAVSLSEGGFVVITDTSDDVVAVSERLESGSHENVTVELDDEFLLGKLTATAHQDTTDDDEFRFDETDGEEDRPYLEQDLPVREQATVAMVDGADVQPQDAFEVISLDGPETTTTNQTATFTGEVHNPTASELRHHAELRVDGELIERQTVNLDGNETKEVTFSVEMADFGPGEFIYGLYTMADGAQQVTVVEFDGPPTVSVLEVLDDGVRVDAGLTSEGFVALEAEDGAVVGTSGYLDAGYHEGVRVDLTEDDQPQTVVVYEGDPADLEEASPTTHDGERVETAIDPDEDGAEADDADDGDDTDDADNGDD